MADLESHKTLKNNKFQILTDEGFKDFDGLIVGTNPNKIKFNFSNGQSLTCTHKHKICDTKNSYIFADNLEVGSTIYNSNCVVDKTYINNDELVYELLEVSDNHRYYVNGILSNQCLLLDELAFIEPDSIVEDFMRSVLPTISRAKTSKILITSTPRGTNNVFYRFYKGAVDGENGFNHEKVDWTEIPGRDEEWKKKEVAKLGSMESFNQEYGCEFISDGTAGIGAELFDELKKDCKEPLHILDDGHYRIWEEPNSEKIYVAGVDVSEGLEKDASVIQILDITNLKEIIQVAEYHNNIITPTEFSNKLHEILQNWGNPLVLIERNAMGAEVCNRIAIDLEYPNVVSWGGKQAHKNQLIGVISHTNTKYRAVLNERYFINEIRSVKFNSLETLNEFKNFVRYPNGSWRAKGGEHDDRVMAFVWALMILYTEITECYFEIVEVDDFGKPLKISPLDNGIRYFENPTSIYTNENIDKIENSGLLPMSFSGSSEQTHEVADLLANGWTFLGGRGNNVEQMDYNIDFDKYF